VSELATAIQQAAGTYQKDTAGFALCEVISVDEAARTCKVRTINGKSVLTYEGVQLMAGVNDGMLLIPTVESQVYISFSKVNTPFVSMFSQLDKVLFVVGEMDIQVTKDGIELNGSNYGGIVKVVDLVSKINTIERDINSLKTAFTTWVVAHNDGGAALKAAAATWYAAQLAITTESELENTTLSHGNE
jgi:hypothetical protein